jgi:hypothetical protein
VDVVVAKSRVVVEFVVEEFVVAKNPVTVAFEVVKLPIEKFTTKRLVAVAFVVDAFTAKKLVVVAEVPVALVKKRLATVSPPVDEAVRKSRSVVDALTAAKSVAVALVNTVEEASTVPLERTERNDNPVEDATLKRFLVDPEVPPI